jgi:RHS repeat-associated protein
MITAVSSAHTLSFAYDEEGRLATTTLDGVPTSYDYNGTMPMGDWTGTAFVTGATETRQHVFGAGGEPLYLTVNGVSTYSHQDALGSTIALSSATAGSTLGKITAEFAYDAFGQPTVPVTSTFGYAGQRVDPTTGLVYDRARFYSPALGRFYVPDPSGYKGGSNLYAYSGNDPVNFRDISGLCGGAGCGNSSLLYSLLVPAGIEIVGNTAIGLEELGTLGGATPAVPFEEAGLAALATEFSTAT